VPKHIADNSPIATPADRPDRRDSAEPEPGADGNPGTGGNCGVAIGPPAARTVVISPLLVPH
jgi:hypothetical protein